MNDVQNIASKFAAEKVFRSIQSMKREDAKSNLSLFCVFLHRSLISITGFISPCLKYYTDTVHIKKHVHLLLDMKEWTVVKTNVFLGVFFSSIYFFHLLLTFCVFDTFSLSPIIRCLPRWSPSPTCSVALPQQTGEWKEKTTTGVTAWVTDAHNSYFLIIGT